MKDFYDIYIFLTKFKDDINIKDFEKAFEKTLINRDSLEYLKDYNKIFDDMLEYEKIQDTWIKYAQKNKYAKGIEFKDIIEVLRDFLDKLN